MTFNVISKYHDFILINLLYFVNLNLIIFIKLHLHSCKIKTFSHKFQLYSQNLRSSFPFEVALKFHRIGKTSNRRNFLFPCLTCVPLKCYPRVIACKEIYKKLKTIRGSVHSTAIRQAFFYAVCCTNLFKKPSALCKEITFLGGGGGCGWGGQSNGPVAWF